MKTQISPVISLSSVATFIGNQLCVTYAKKRFTSPSMFTRRPFFSCHGCFWFGLFFILIRLLCSIFIPTHSVPHMLCVNLMTKIWKVSHWALCYDNHESLMSYFTVTWPCRGQKRHRIFNTFSVSLVNVFFCFYPIWSSTCFLFQQQTTSRMDYFC